MKRQRVPRGQPREVEGWNVNNVKMRKRQRVLAEHLTPTLGKFALFEIRVFLYAFLSERKRACPSSLPYS